MSNTETKPTKEQIDKHIQVIKAISDTIRELKQIPSGHLYARVMEFMTLDQYNTIIGILVSCKFVKLHASHLLEWVGP